MKQSDSHLLEALRALSLRDTATLEHELFSYPDDEEASGK